jgi:hypothetical protein
MKELKTSKRFLFVSLILCVALAASAVAAQAQEPQQGAKHTSRSNIKNTSRTDLQSQLHTLRVEVARHGGAQISGAQTRWKAYKIDKAGDFNFGFLPSGKYELRVTSVDADGDTPSNTSSKKVPEEARPPSSFAAGITITLDGVKGGPIKKELALITSSTRTDTPRTGLDDRISTMDEKQNGKTFGPGRPVFGNITVETDGKSEVRGAVRHLAAMNSIRNM